MYEGDEINSFDGNGTYDRPGAIVSSSPDEQQNVSSSIKRKNNANNTNPYAGVYGAPVATERTTRTNMKRPILFAVVGVAAIAIVAIISVMIVNAIGPSRSSIAKDFKILANLVIFGEEKEDLNTEYSLNDGINLVAKTDKYEDNKEYYTKVNNAAVRLVESIKKSSLTDNEKVDITTYAIAMIAWCKQAEFNSFEDTLLDKLKTDKYNGTKQYIHDHYSLLTDSSNKNLKEGGKSLQEASTMYLDIIDSLMDLEPQLNNVAEAAKKHLSKSKISSFDSRTYELRNDAEVSIGTEFKTQISKTWEYNNKLGEGK